MGAREHLKDLWGRVRVAAYARRKNREVEHFEVDPGIEYPSYKSFDDIIDVERLKSLDGYLVKKIREQLQRRDQEQFHAGVLKQKFWQRAVPGTLVIPLTKSTRPFNYLDLDKAELWERTEKADEFSELMAFIDTLPFKKMARIMIMCEDGGRGTTAHRDHGNQDINHEFIWFRSSFTKPFYMYSSKTKVKKYVESYSAWFDSVNQYHGSESTKGLSFSIRVDGTFSDELRAQIPVPTKNRASTPSKWACQEKALAHR
jgi:hypothetical protein